MIQWSKKTLGKLCDFDLSTLKILIFFTILFPWASSVTNAVMGPCLTGFFFVHRKIEPKMVLMEECNESQAHQGFHFISLLNETWWKEEDFFALGKAASMARRPTKIGPYQSHIVFYQLQIPLKEDVSEFLIVCFTFIGKCEIRVRNDQIFLKTTNY